MVSLKEQLTDALEGASYISLSRLEFPSDRFESEEAFRERDYSFVDYESLDIRPQRWIVNVKVPQDTWELNKFFLDALLDLFDAGDSVIDRLSYTAEEFMEGKSEPLWFDEPVLIRYQHDRVYNEFSYGLQYSKYPGDRLYLLVDELDLQNPPLPSHKASSLESGDPPFLIGMHGLDGLHLNFLDQVDDPHWKRYILKNHL